MMKSRILLLSLLLSINAFATTYYVAPNGNDVNNGTSTATAWLTLDRVSQAMNSFQAGDLILFKRGGIYRGTLTITASGTQSSPIVFGAFGSGNDPVISGSDVITGWTPYQNGIWQAHVNTKPTYVFADGQLMTIARYPNSGWLTNELGSTSQLHDDQLTDPDGTWTGGQAVIRSTMWSFNVVKILSHAAGTITFDPMWYNLGVWDWGYFLQNKLSALDTPGEWYCDTVQQTLYMMPPGGADPNTMTVEGAVRTDGFRFEYDRHDIKVQDLDFSHQTEASVYNNGAYRFDVENCSFRQAMMGVWSYGHDDIVRGCDLHNIYGTGMHLIDDNVVVESNVLRDIAIVPGLGESNWGYFGMRTIGIAPQVRYNDLSRIGYTGLEVKGNALVEYNRVDQTNYILNDGGGIAFDNADGMIIRKNVITDCLGSLDGAPTEHDNYFSLVNGLYFGNTSIKNSLITENTVSGCGNSGLYADHTMVNINNQITNNVFFNNGKVQARFSDDSNSMGNNAVAPYYIAQYNDVFTGNTMISLTEDQICLEWVHVHTNGTTDFGTFDNNAYYNAYNEQCIQFRDHFNGNIKYHFTLAQWQATKNKDWSSAASPKRWSQYDVTAVTGPDLVQQGTFDSNTNGWTAWPTNGTITRDLTYLDNGALRCYLPDNSQYTEFSVRNSNNTFPVQNGNWYRMQMSIQSDNYGEVRAGVKGVTQLTGLNMVYEKYIPFSPVRRDVEFVFQSGLTDQAFCQLVNSYTLPRYWLDNVHVNQVNTQLLDPMNKHQLLTNLGTTDQSFDLVGCWSDAHGVPYSGSVTVQPYRSLALIKEDDVYCGLSTGTTDINGSMTEVVAFPVPISAGERITFSHVDQAAMVQVFDLNGRSVQQERINEGAPGFAVRADLAAGLYTAIITGSGSVRRAKLEVR